MKKKVYVISGCAENMQFDRQAAVALSDCKCKDVVSQGIMDSCDELNQEL